MNHPMADLRTESIADLCVQEPRTMMGWMTGSCKTQFDLTHGEFNPQNQKH